MIPYNPSSFNTNKTILEQILELKNWLKDHPQYEVYYCNDNASLYPFMNTFSLANVPDNTNMDVGDLVVCNNAVYCTVISIDRDNGVFTAGYGVSFKGDTGAAGQQGYSLRVSSENYVDDVTAYHRNSLEPSHGTRENDTILFANGYVGIVTSLGAGATYYVTNRTVSFVGPQGPQGPQGPTGATGPQGPTGPTGADGNDGVSITNVAIDGSSHLIVTLSDGTTIDAGSVSSGGSHIVTLTTYSGTLTDEQYNTLLNDDAIIIYNSGTELIFHKEYESDTEMSFYRVNSSNYRQVYTITKSTKAYARTTAGIRSSAVDSQTATNGQVLMANGSGGASWQTPSGSGPNVVTLTGVSGTLNASQLALVQQDNTIIKIGNDTYILQRNTSSRVYYITSSLNYSGRYISNTQINIIKSSGSWSLEYTTAYQNPEGNIIKSTGATNGQVLTADGSGNASWQNAGGSTLYNHSIYFEISNTFKVNCLFISQDSSYNMSQLITYINSKGAVNQTRVFVATGFVDISGTKYSVVGIYRGSGGTLGIAYFDGSDILGTTFSTGSIAFSDTSYTI